MEGTEEAPQTPDGGRIVEILRRAGIAFQIFDVSGNAPAREELKQEFKWDRFPHPSTRPGAVFIQEDASGAGTSRATTWVLRS